MELIFILIAIVYSVWSEMNKKKEEDINIDFSELSSLDEFFKNDQKGSPAQKKSSYVSNKPSRPQNTEKKSKPRANHDNLPGLTGQVNYTRVDEKNRKPRANHDNLPGLTGQVNYTRVDEKNRKPKVNYDNLPGLTGQTNYARVGANDVEPDLINQEHEAMVARDLKSSTRTGVGFSFDKNDVLKAFVLNEVLQPYDINRIYSRIPGLPKEE